jgi:hypothetical protein
LGAVLRYAGVALFLVLAASSVLWFVLDSAGRRGLLLAASLAVPVQVGLFALLHRFRNGGNAFLAAWVGGILARLLLAGGVTVLVLNWGLAAPVVTVLAFVGFLFGLLLLEPPFLR